MYRVEIDGILHGVFKTPEEAMADVKKWAMPFGKSWVVYDPWGKICARS